MSEAQKPSDKTEAEKTSFFKSPAHLLLLAVVFIILLISGFYIQQNRTSEPSPTTMTSNSSSQNLSMTASNQNPQTGEVVRISIWEDSGDQAVNAVQANLNYSTDKFDFVSTDVTKSAFEIQAQNTVKNGKVIIARGHKGNLSGRQLVAVIKLKAKDSPGSASLSFSGDSHLVSSLTNEDILKQSNDITLTIGN